ncbi:MAG: cytochrome c-type biogenesis protein CcmH [Alphaproteobacteria bacterium]|nr:cytochrome c-type biogenesis protein CcmH [Alphaproteobacteria bacterium]
MRLLLASLAILFTAGLTLTDRVNAVQPDEVLADPTLEARARDISAELRCVVCQNQSIDDSDAEIARDLRLLVRERLVAGDSDEEVVDFVVARYGDFVLLRPPFQPNTYMLWLGPPFMAVVIATLFVLFLRGYQRRRAAGLGPEPLSPNDRAELDALVDRIAASTPPGSEVKHGFRAELADGLQHPPGQDAPGDVHEPDPEDDVPGNPGSPESDDTPDSRDTSRS